MYSARAQDGPQDMERNQAVARHGWARQHAWLLLSFFPFRVGHPEHEHCSCRLENLSKITAFRIATPEPSRWATSTRSTRRGPYSSPSWDTVSWGRRSGSSKSETSQWSYSASRGQPKAIFLAYPKTSWRTLISTRLKKIVLQFLKFYSKQFM